DERGHEFGSAVGVDLAVLFAALTANRHHGRGCAQVETELLADDGGKLRTFEIGDEAGKGRTKVEAREGKASRMVDHGKVGADRVEGSAADEAGHDEVGKRT